MSRSKWKGPYLTRFFLKKKLNSANKQILIYNRNLTIPFFLLGKSVFIHNGKEFIKTFVSRDKIGFKFGEFSYTRKIGIKSKKNSKKI
jgi:small subunit ribosomal protein S19